MHSYSHLVELFHKEETESEEADARNLRTTHRKAAKTQLGFVYYSLLFVVTRMGIIHSSTSLYFARALICLLLRLRRRIRFLAHLALISTNKLANKLLEQRQQQFFKQSPT